MSWPVQGGESELAQVRPSSTFWGSLGGLEWGLGLKILLGLCKSLRQHLSSQQELAEVEAELKKPSKSWFFES